MQVEVKFNTAVDKTTAQTITNYGGLSVVANGAVVQSDNKTVVLNLTAPGLTQYVDYPMTIVNVKSADGKVMEAYNTTIKPVDTTIPSLVSVTALGSQTLELTFSEPIQNLGTIGNYKVDNVVLTGPATATASAFNTKVTLGLAADLVPGEHKVAVFADGTLDLMDYASLLVPAKELKFTVEEDTALPQVASIEVLSQTKVKVAFSKPMNITNANIGDFYWNTTGMASDVAKPANAQKKIDAKTFEITFANNPLPAGEVHFFVKDVQDFNANPIAGNVATNRYGEKITVAADSAPAVTGVKAKTDTTLEVTFSTDMKQASAQTASKYAIKDGEGKAVNITGVPAYNPTTKVATITMATAMSGTKAYTVTVKDVEAVSGAKTVEQSFNVAVIDTTPPTVSGSVSWSGQNVVINYSEPMSVTGDNSVLRLANYQFTKTGGTIGDLPAGTTIAAFNNNKSVRITFPTTVTLAAGDNIAIGYLKAATSYNVADANGNLMAYSPTNALGAAGAALDISTATAKAEIVNPTTLKFIYAGTSSFGTVVASDFKFTVGTKTVYPTAVALDAKDTTNKTLLFTVSDSDKFTAATSAVTIETLAGVRASKDAFGQSIDGGKTVTPSGAGNFANKIAAKITAVTVAANNLLYIEFDAGVPGTQAANLQNALQVVQGDKTYTGSTYLTCANIAGTSDKRWSITLSTATVDITKAVTVKTVEQDFILVKDANGNYLVANTTGLTAEAGLSVLTSLWADTDTDGMIGNSDTFKFTFNRNIDLASVKTGWDGTTVGTGAITLAFNSADGTITIPGVGVISGLVIAGNANLAGTIAYNDATFEITATIGAAAPRTTIAGANYVFTPASTIKTTGGNAITVSSIGNTAAVPANAAYLKSAVFTDGASKDGKFVAGNNTDADQIVLTFNKNVTAAAAASLALYNGLIEVSNDAGTTWKALAEIDAATGLNSAALTYADATATNSATVTLKITAAANSKGIGSAGGTVGDIVAGTTMIRVKSDAAATVIKDATGNFVVVGNAVTITK